MATGGSLWPATLPQPSNGLLFIPLSWDGLATPTPGQKPLFERPIGCLTYREEGIPVKIMKAMSDCHDMKFPHGWCLACLHENIQILPPSKSPLSTAQLLKEASCEFLPEID